MNRSTEQIVEARKHTEVKGTINKAILSTKKQMPVSVQTNDNSNSKDNKTKPNRYPHSMIVRA
ncbi:hypothetical protein T4D_8116 [Trichinella pseudospiralis]|uniref:Uncharacterized protein n=1 Tax=Trichinella pseudospiralis TaxID=6337 RepID=A0A0V1FQS3_TRIPS|nr:hypothetical protein T4D_8116 [Trichinella pseudospiralis]